MIIDQNTPYALIDRYLPIHVFVSTLPPANENLLLQHDSTVFKPSQCLEMPLHALHALRLRHRATRIRTRLRTRRVLPPQAKLRAQALAGPRPPRTEPQLPAGHRVPTGLPTPTRPKTPTGRSPLARTPMATALALQPPLPATAIGLQPQTPPLMPTALKLRTRLSLARSRRVILLTRRTRHAGRPPCKNTG